MQDWNEDGEYNNMRIFLFKVWENGKFMKKYESGSLYPLTFLTFATGVRQRNVNLFWKDGPGTYVAWVEPDRYGDINAPQHHIVYNLGVYSMQSENPTTLELHSEEKFPHDEVLGNMFSKVLKSEHHANGEKLIREENDPGLCYMDKTADMGYLFICYECDPCMFKCNVSGNACVEKQIEEEGGATKFIKVGLDSTDYNI